MRATIKDIARLAGVSTQTVSNVVNDRPVVGEATRRKVLEACAEYSFEQGLTPRLMKLDELFAPGVLNT